MRRARIALLDNTINGAYIFGKLLRREGYEADFIQQPNLPFNQQPVWEDIDHVEDAAQVFERFPRDSYWRALERRAGWKRPEWVKRPSPSLRDIGVFAGLPRRLLAGMPAALVPVGFALAAPTAPILAALRDYDFVLVAGPSAGSAYLARRPYAVITMGWDIFTLPFWTESPSPIRRARSRLQRAALGSAVHILGLPSMDLEFARRLGLEDNLRPFPIAVDVDGYAAIEAGSRASVFGDALALRMEGRLVYFCPSRISYEEKGQDLLLRAFAQVRREVPAFLVLVGWGHEVGRAKSLIAELGLSGDVEVLPWVMSKRRLIRALRASDVATVQFILGGYGGVAREALACGAPVVSSYDPAAPQPHPRDDPAPILSASTVETIRDAMLRLADPSLRRTVGAAGQVWARRHHQSAPLVELDRILDEIGAS